MIKLTKLQELRLTKEYLLPRLEKYLERGIVYRGKFVPRHITKLKEWGVIEYSQRGYHYIIVIDVYNKLRREEGL